jgi:plasmid stability protein
MEEEARHILRESLDRQRPETAADIARELFGPEHGFELDLPPRVAFRPPPDFSNE